MLVLNFLASNFINQKILKSGMTHLISILRLILRVSLQMNPYELNICAASKFIAFNSQLQTANMFIGRVNKFKSQ